MKRTITCHDCGQTWKNAGRGLCSKCYSRRRNAGTLSEVRDMRRVEPEDFAYHGTWVLRCGVRYPEQVAS